MTDDELNRDLAAAVAQQREKYPDWPDDLGVAYQVVAGQCARIAKVISCNRAGTNCDDSVFESIFILEVKTRRWLQELKRKFDTTGKLE